MSRTNSTAVVVFQKTLPDIVKGIRAQRRDPSSFISESIAEIKRELQETDPFVKAEAVRKLTYIQMMGYNVSWASFSIMEVMSQARFEHKRIGYLAANQSFTESTDILMLTTNLFKKEFSAQSSRNHYEIGLAMNCLANIANKDLARDCMSDVVSLLNHSRPYIRKKAVICLFKLYIKYPQGLRLTFDSLMEKLNDSDGSVVSCAVNVICELARKNPKNYLSMAPKFFKLLTTSSNNWMLIKVVKLLGSLVAEEPRLARKLLEPLATIIQNTSAKSLQYECIHTITLALPYTKREDGSDAKNVPAVLNLCGSHLHDLVKDEDQNLKYLGLVGLLQLMESHPRVVVEERELILKCLVDEDVTIRSKSVELLSRMVTKKSLRDLVQHLLKHLRTAEGSYRDEIISHILSMGCKDTYSLVSDFIWYMSVLQRLACTQSGAAAGRSVQRTGRDIHHGKHVSEQIMEIALRVKAVRPYAVECMASMLVDGGKLILGQAKDTVAEVLKAAAWVCGEYAEVLLLIMLDQKKPSDDDDDEEEEEEDEGYWIDGPDGDEIRSKWRNKPLAVFTVESLLHPRATNLPPDVQCAFVHAAMKIFVLTADPRCEKCHTAQVIALLRVRLPVFLQSVHLEVQERASSFRYLLSELGVLRIESAEHQEDTGNAAEDIEDLISFPQAEGGEDSATSNQKIEVLPVDVAGAERVHGGAYPLLCAIFAERFYSVHPKAQRKVPVPEGLSLSEPFNQKAVVELLGGKDKSDTSKVGYEPSMSSVVFVGKSTDLHGSSNGKSNDPKGVAASFAQDSSDQSDDESPYAFPVDSSASVSAGGSSSIGVPDKTFYLQQIDRSDAVDDGERGSDEDMPHGNDEQQKTETRRKKVKRGGKKGKKDSSSKSSSKANRKDATINRQDMQPAGAVDNWSSDDDTGVFRNVAGVKSRKTGVNDEDSEDDKGLENIDITTPLQAGEALPVHKHRETPATGVRATDVKESAGQGEQISRKKKSNRGDKKEKKEKREKKEKKSKDREQKDKPVTTVPLGDLIGLDTDWPLPSIPVDQAAVRHLTQESATVSAGVTSPSQAAVDTKKRQSSSSKNSSGRSAVGSLEHLYTDKSRVEILQATDYLPADQLRVTYHVKNITTTGFALSLVCIGIGDQSSHAYRVSDDSDNPVTRNVEPGGERTLAVTYDIAPGLQRTQVNVLWVTVQVTSDSLIGPETSAVGFAKLSLSPCKFLEPHELTPDAYTSLLASTANPGSSASVGSGKIKLKTSSSKLKKTFKTLCKALNAYQVEYEENKAMSLCSKVFHQGGKGEFTVVCTLLKGSSSGKHITADLKCLGRDVSVCQAIADDTVSALGLLSL